MAYDINQHSDPALRPASGDAWKMMLKAAVVKHERSEAARRCPVVIVSPDEQSGSLHGEQQATGSTLKIPRLTPDFAARRHQWLLEQAKLADQAAKWQQVRSRAAHDDVARKAKVKQQAQSRQQNLALQLVNDNVLAIRPAPGDRFEFDAHQVQYGNAVVEYRPESIQVRQADKRSTAPELVRDFGHVFKDILAWLRERAQLQPTQQLLQIYGGRNLPGAQNFADQLQSEFAREEVLRNGHVKRVPRPQPQLNRAQQQDSSQAAPSMAGLQAQIALAEQRAARLAPQLQPSPELLASNNAPRLNNPGQTPQFRM